MPVINISRGAFSSGQLLPERNDRRRIALLHQPVVAELASGLLQRFDGMGLETHRYQLPPDEDAKTWEQVGRLYRWLNSTGITRQDTVAVIGGGAATDVGGFVAATYLRGVEAVYYPTTLLGAVDAAIGGKTAVNVGGKNLAGVFAHPSAIVVDIDVIDSLPLEFRIDGMAEVLKAGLVGDPGLVQLLETDGLDVDTETIVTRAIAVKTRVVDADFREQGIRSFLNYGHTIGHAIEVACRLRHGPAIAVGMEAAALLSENRLGFAGRSRQRDILEALSLPTSAAGDQDEVFDLVGLDKKRNASGLRMVLLHEVGVPALVPVSAAEVRSAIAGVLA